MSVEMDQHVENDSQQTPVINESVPSQPEEINEIGDFDLGESLNVEKSSQSEPEVLDEPKNTLNEIHSEDQPEIEKDDFSVEPRNVNDDQPEVLDVEEEPLDLDLKINLEDSVVILGDNIAYNTKPAVEIEEIDDEDDDDEDIDETVIERLIGLTEMFPQTVRNNVCSLFSGSISLLQNSYSLSRTITWFICSSSVVMLAPAMIEVERSQAQRALNKQMLLGQGSGNGMMGMPPPPAMTK